jgi:hypothetical protein
MEHGDRDSGSTEELVVESGAAGRLIDRADAARRRHLSGRAGLAAVCALGAILFAANGFGLLGGDSAKQQPPDGLQPLPSASASVTSTEPPDLHLSLVTAPESAQLAALAPLSFTSGNEVHLGGRAFRIPSDWAIVSLTTAGEGLLLHVVLPNAPTGPWSEGFLAYLSPDGALRELFGGHVPFLVNPSGTLLLSRTQKINGQLSLNEPLVTIDLATGAQSTVQQPVTGRSDDLFVEGFVGEKTLLVSPEVGSPQLWWLTIGVLSPLPAHTTLLAASARGDRLLSDARGMVEQTPDGATRWRARPFGDVVGYSPPGDLLAALTPSGAPTGVTVRSVASGTEVMRFTLAVVDRPHPGGQVTAVWADDRTLIVQTGGEQGADARYARCTIGTTRCADLAVIHTGVLLPGQRFFE